MNLEKLKEPFPASDIEWRIGQSGKKSNGEFWAKVLAYISARAIQDRLDEVVGPANWKAEYQVLDGGVICRLGILVPRKSGSDCHDFTEWVFKEDGAEQTEIQAFKGGISSSLKRAGSAWGIGRYLYNLEAVFAKTSLDKQDGYEYAKTKEGVFYWKPPELPASALPAGTKTPPPVKAPVQQIANPINPVSGVDESKPPKRSAVGAVQGSSKSAPAALPGKDTKIGEKISGTTSKGVQHKAGEYPWTWEIFGGRHNKKKIGQLSQDEIQELLFEYSEIKQPSKAEQAAFKALNVANSKLGENDDAGRETGATGKKGGSPRDEEPPPHFDEDIPF